MKNYRNKFKCKCMNYYDQKTTGVWLMSGKYDYHISLINLTKPEGLHRTLYRLLPDKMEEFLNVNEDKIWDSCFEKVVYRYNKYALKIPRR